MGPFAVLGMIIVILAALTGILFVSAVIVFWLMDHFPRFHFGAPKASMELRSYGRSKILTGKDFGSIEDCQLLELFQKLDVVKWYGISSRNRVSWFCGFIVFKDGKR